MEVQKNQWKAWIYLAPTIILMIVFTMYPLINTFIVAFKENYQYANFYDKNGSFDGFGLKNFKILLIKDPILNPNGDFINTYLKNTALLAVISVPLSIILALLISVALNSIPKFQKILQTIFFLPYVTNAIAIGMVFAFMFNTDYGLINTLLDWVGVDRIEWLGSFMGKAEMTQMYIVLMSYIIWNALPFKILILLSGLQSIDKQYYQAAQIDGTSKGRTLLKITVPLLSPQIVYLTITSFIGAFKEYSSIISIFGPNATPTNWQRPVMGTVVWYIYNNIKGGPDGYGMGYAAAGAVILFIIIMIITAFNAWVSKRYVHY